MTRDDLQGRVAIVTGGSRGIGWACAAHLAERGARVVLIARDRVAVEGAATEIPDGRAIGIAADALDQAVSQQAVEAVVERFGSVDILVNSVGIGARAGGTFGPLAEVEHAAFQRTIDINLWAPAFWSGLVWRAWMREHGGVIIHVSSLAALGAMANIATYSASKAGLQHVTRDQALELAPKVRVNAVAPGVIKTKMAEQRLALEADAILAGTPLARLGEPEDVARAVGFLASDASSWITGETILVDGGALLASPA